MHRELTDVEVAWLAGLYEGEGSAYCRTYLVNPERNWTGTLGRVTIAMTDRDILERVDAMFPSPSGIKARKFQSGQRKTLYYWSVSRRERVAAFLRLVLPFLGERRTAQALAVLAIVEDPMRGTGSQHRRKTHCPQGHPFDAENTYVSTTRKGGINRQCRICRTAAWKRSNAKRQAAKRTGPNATDLV